jgi:hypothetical protein
MKLSLPNNCVGTNLKNIAQEANKFGCPWSFFVSSCHGTDMMALCEVAAK